jgi:hypothetical protein
MSNCDLFNKDYNPSFQPYEIEVPEIESGDTYYFVTGSGLKYQVRFGKKKDNYLGNIINFSVLSDEFEDEYSETNRGEVYHIVATVIEIIRIYHQHHLHSDAYEFTGEFKDEHESQTASIRSRLYYRYTQKILDPCWIASLEGNKVTIKKNKSQS